MAKPSEKYSFVRIRVQVHGGQHENLTAHAEEVLKEVKERLADLEDIYDADVLVRITGQGRR